MKRLIPVLAVMALLAVGGAALAQATPVAPDPGTLEATVLPGDAAAPIDWDEVYDNYLACLAVEGVEVDETNMFAFETEAERDAWDAADAVCFPILEEAHGGFELSAEEEAQFMAMELRFAECMRENGVEAFPDPTGDMDQVIEITDDVGTEVLDLAFEACGEEVYGEGMLIIDGDELIVGGELP